MVDYWYVVEVARLYSVQRFGMNPLTRPPLYNGLRIRSSLAEAMASSRDEHYGDWYWSDDAEHAAANVPFMPQVSEKSDPCVPCFFPSAFAQSPPLFVCLAQVLQKVSYTVNERASFTGALVMTSPTPPSVEPLTPPVGLGALDDEIAPPRAQLTAAAIAVPDLNVAQNAENNIDAPANSPAQEAHGRVVSSESQDARSLTAEQPIEKVPSPSIAAVATDALPEAVLPSLDSFQAITTADSSQPAMALANIQSSINQRADPSLSASALVNNIHMHPDAFAQPFVHQSSMNSMMTLGSDIDGQMTSHFLDTTPYMEKPPPTTVAAYAMLEFEDGVFYMTTHQIILGRDLGSAAAAKRREAELAQGQLEPGATGEPQTPVRVKRQVSRYTHSVMSESGGIIGEYESERENLLKKNLGKKGKASKKSKSETGSSSQRNSRRNSLTQATEKSENSQPQVKLHALDNDLAAPLDPTSLLPSPDGCPVVGLHPGAAAGFNSISRKHVKIYYNSQRCLFQAEIQGRNGAFIDEKYHVQGETVDLKSGSKIQISGVVIHFVLPQVAQDSAPVDEDEQVVPDIYSEGGKEMSFDFEETSRDGILADSSDESSEDEDERQVVKDDESGDDDAQEQEDEDRMETVEGDDGEEEEDDEQDLEDDEELIVEEDSMDAENIFSPGDGAEAPEAEPSQAPPKRRGPGRPPKDGIMSKREQALRKKEALAKAKKTLPQEQQPQQPVPGKNKVGRPRKHPLPENPPVEREKRKYTKRKPKDPDAPPNPDGTPGEQGSPKERKEKKPPRPPRSPTPTFNEADLTPEQLQKPNLNYVQLIHDALSNSPDLQPMSLPQIYRAIERKYPYFVLKCTTTGWQSSVRHNLSQHAAFRKVERDGKGWVWTINPGVPIEKEKKPRPTPPLPPGIMPHQQIYSAGPYPPHMMQRPPPGYPPYGMPLHMQPGQHPQYPPPPNGYRPPGMPPPVQFQQPVGPPPPIPMQASAVPGAGGASYSSPYAPKPTQNPPAPPPPPPPTAPSLNHQQPTPSAPGLHNPPPPNVKQGLQANDITAKALENFKNSLINQLKLSGQGDRAETIVTSAINRVLGIHTLNSGPPDPFEEKLMAATRMMLSKLQGVPQAQQPAPSPTPPPQPQLPAHAVQQPPLPPPMAGGFQHGIPPAPSPVPVAPPFSTAPPSMSPPKLSAPRPAMGVPSIKREDSAPNAPQPPALAPPTSQLSQSSLGPSTAESKPSTSPAPSAPADTAGGSAAQSAMTNGNGKRSLDDADIKEEPDFKRLTTGPPPLKA
jgi:hypothetical protein